MITPTTGLVFGIYPFGIAGMASGVATGPPDDYLRLPQIIDNLRGGRDFLLRTYVPYFGPHSIDGCFAQLDFCAVTEMPWDIALCFRDKGGDLNGWLGLIRDVVQRHGKLLHSLQITNEPNLTHVPDAADGGQPQVRQALIQGVLAAKQAAIVSGATVQIGFNAVPTFLQPNDFWEYLKQNGGEFAQSLDYVGLDFYPDVFGGPITLEHLPQAVEKLLRDFRSQTLAAGIPNRVPMRIPENGWPTGPNRPYERQSQVLEAVIRTVHRLRNELNITHYELFGLRDAHSSNENLFYQFGIMRDDYTPKPAFEVYRKLIEELGS